MREGRQQIRLYDVRIVGAAAVDALASAHCSQASPQAARAVDATSVPQTAIETNRVHLLDYVVVWIAVATHLRALALESAMTNSLIW